MRKKILWLGLSFLLVVALVLAACGPAEVGEQEEEEEITPPVGEQEEEEEEEEEAVTPAVGEPQYGGTLTYCYRCGAAGSADTTRVFWPGTSKVFVVLEHLIMGDLYKGPRGTNEHAFQNEYPPPDEYSTGWLAESWTVSAEAITFKIREGVMWSGSSPNPVMDGPREFTAYDAEFFLKYYMDGPVSSMGPAGFIDSIEATDRYTVVVHTNRFDADWVSTIVHGWGAGMMPKETVDAGAADFDNLVGTGPFVLREHRIGTYMVFDPNPVYWKGTIIDGKEWKIPFVDELYLPEIIDKSTKVAAIRTGQIEMYLGFFDPIYAEELDKVEGLIRKRAPHSWHHWAALRTDRPPFDNKNVRRAVTIGTDRLALATVAWGRLDNINQFPAADLCTGIYTEIADMPASTKLLFTYDPVLAKQMLADEGYPDGLEVSMIYRTGAVPGILDDVASEMKAQWLKMGVDLDIMAMDSVSFASRLASREWESDMWLLNSPPYHPMEAIRITYMPGGFHNAAFYDDPTFNSNFNKAMTTIDLTERRAILKGVVLQALDDAPYIPLWHGYGDTYWWPWIKNYYGEISLGRCHAPLADIWLDQDLKAEMGY